MEPCTMPGEGGREGKREGGRGQWVESLSMHKGANEARKKKGSEGGREGIPWSV